MLNMRTARAMLLLAAAAIFVVYVIIGVINYDPQPAYVTEYNQRMTGSFSIAPPSAGSSFNGYSYSQPIIRSGGIVISRQPTR